MDSLKVLDPEGPIREADITLFIRASAPPPSPENSMTQEKQAARERAHRFFVAGCPAECQ
jgi:hypothetical protein